VDQGSGIVLLRRQEVTELHHLETLAFVAIVIGIVLRATVMRRSSMVAPLPC
jgi:hypothetical protein